MESPLDNKSPEGRITARENEPSFLFLYFLKIRGCPVRREGDKVRIGRLEDLIVETALPYPRTAGIVVRSGLWKMQCRPWNEVRAVNPFEIVVSAKPADPNWQPAPPLERAGRDWLGRWAIEVSTRSIVRLYDFHLLYSEDTMLLAHAETGVRGWLRRWGLEPSALFILGRLFPNLFKERFATFRHLQILRPVRGGGTLLVPPRLLEMEPADLETIIVRLPRSMGLALFETLPDPLAVRVLQEAPSDVRNRLLRSVPPDRQMRIQTLLKESTRSRPLQH